MNSKKAEKLDEETYALLSLSFCEGVGNLAVHRLLACFGSASKVLAAGRGELCSVEGLSEKLIASIRKGPDDGMLEDELDLLDRCHTELLAFGSDSYPELLKHLGEGSPPLLRIRGDYLSRDRLSVALVGSRNCTHYGRTQARRFSMALAEKGFTIVSGHARGIDSECHRAALNADGRTIAVLGCGIGRLEKLGDPELALDIAENGALLSELPMNAPPLAKHFPPRNRLISGLANGVVVVEAGKKSGSLITARCAGEQGRSVFAIPGSIMSASSRGCHQLIRDGAFLTENPNQILEELGPLPEPVSMHEDGEEAENDESEVVKDPRELSLNEREKKVLKVVEHQPRLFDDIIEDTRLSVSELSSVLMSLEIRGLVTRLEGNRYVLA